MANSSIPNLTALTSWATGDLAVVVDVGDTSQDASGTDKKITLANLFNLPNGSAADPILAFQNSTTTGLYRSAADVIGVSIAGTARWAVDSNIKCLTNGSGLQGGTGSDANFNLDIDFPDVSTAIARLRVFRDTNTSGTREFIVHQGDGTGTEVFNVSPSASTITGTVPITIQEHTQESERAAISDDATQAFTGITAEGGSFHSLYILIAGGNEASRHCVFVADNDSTTAIITGSAVSLGDAANPDVDGNINVWMDASGNVNVKNRLGGPATFNLVRIGT